MIDLLIDSRLILPLGLVFAGHLGILFALVLHLRLPDAIAWQLVSLASIALALVGLVWSTLRFGCQLLYPIVNLEESVARVCQGEVGSSESLQRMGVLDGIARDVAALNEELTELYEEMDHRVARQTRRLAQKTACLRILYDASASINQAGSLDELLLRFLRVLKEMAGARAGTARLIMPDGKRRLIGSIGLEDHMVAEQDMAPVDLCLCGRALPPGDILCGNDARYCSRIYGRKMFGSDEIDLLTVPLEYGGEILGAYSLFVDKPGPGEREDSRELLSTVGHHLGMAIAKQRSDAEAHRLSIIEERNALAHELHDSLAQTLASLRFQFKMLADSLAGTPISNAARTDLDRIRSGLDEAHTELRELLASFREPLDRHGLVTALEKLTQRLGQETGMHVLFQNDCRTFDLGASDELQTLRVVQEALTNIRKHARAHTVRVLLTRRGEDERIILVEDDGVGFSTREKHGKPGEHIGLSIMEERARRIGAELRIESEPGEGTRVELTFARHKSDAQKVSVQCVSC